jgi:hypothetical protein
MLQFNIDEKTMPEWNSKEDAIEDYIAKRNIKFL